LAYLDTDFKFVEVNSAYVLGSGYGKNELIGKNHFDLFPNKENEKIFQTVRDTGQPIEFHAKPFEYEVDPTRGITYWDWTLKPVKDKSGKVIGLILSLNDVTDGHKSKEKSKKSALKLLTFTSISIFLVEAIIMWLLIYIPGLSTLSRVLFDSFLLILIIFPILLVFIFRPLIYNITEKKRIQKSLINAYDMMEVEIRARTQELAESNKQLKTEIKNKENIEQELIAAKNDLEENVKLRTQELTEANKKLMDEINERNLAEEKLETERQRLFSVLDEIPASVHLVAMDHSIRFANRYFRDRFGNPKDQPCYKVLHGSDKPCKICEADQVFKLKMPGEFEERHSDGRLYHVYDYPFKDIDGEDLILQLGIDITEKKQAETDLKESEKKFRGLVNSMNDTVFTLDNQFRLTGIYGTYLEKLGLNISNYDGKKIADIVDKQNVHIHVDAMQEASTGKTVIYEWEADTPEGKVFFQNSLSPIYDNNDNLIEIVGVARDITRQKNMERKIIQTEKLMAVAQMSAMISHEFRNSLTSLKMILELQLESDSLVEPEKKSLNVALSSVSHMENIVGQLVTFSRPGPLQIGPVNLNEVIDECVQFIHIQIEKYKIELSIQLDDSLPILKLDVLRIKEVITNLLLNSIQSLSGKDDTVQKKLKVRTSKTVIQKQTWDQSYSGKKNGDNRYLSPDDETGQFLAMGTDCVLLQVEDNGSGIEPEEREHIFDPFFTTKSSGTGLGLPLVKRIINEHGGIITVDSSVNSGTILNVYLPVENDDKN
jgi:PAS domain S-box-containing protein